MERQKGITTLGSLSILIILIIIGGAVYFNTRSKAEIMMNEGQEIKKEGEAMMNEGQEIKKEGEAMIEKGEGMMETSAGVYEDYSPEKVANAKGDIVLFFHATWCPTCRSLNNNIESNLSEIPAGTTILKLDYDNSSELKKKYGVTTQHTLVQVDVNGNLISKWSGSPTLSSLISNIK